MKKDELIKQHEEANEFIIKIAKMLKMDTDSVGFDGIQFSLDDFQEAINLSNQSDEEIDKWAKSQVSFGKDMLPLNMNEEYLALIRGAKWMRDTPNKDCDHPYWAVVTKCLGEINYCTICKKDLNESTPPIKEQGETRIFGDKDDKQFWADKPIQKNHPKEKELKDKEEVIGKITIGKTKQNYCGKCNYKWDYMSEHCPQCKKGFI